VTISILADFEGFTNATALSNTNSDDHGDHATSEVFPGTSGIIETSTTRAAEGSSSLRFSQATSSQQCRIRYNPGANFTQGAVSFYIHPTGIPGTDANFPFRIFTDAGGSCFQILTRTTGVLRLANSAGAVQASTSSPGILSANPTNFFRIEAQWSALNGASSSLALQVFDGHNTTPLTNGSISATNVTTGNGRELVFGKTSTAVLADWWIDGIQASVDSNAAIGPWPSVVDKIGSETFILTEAAAALLQARTSTDTITLTDEFTSLVQGFSSNDTQTLIEEVTETEVNDNTDSATLTETASLTSATTGTDSFLQGDDVSASIPTGDQAVSWGGALSNNYFVAAEGDVSDLAVGNKGLLYTAAGAVKEPTLFHITSLSDPAFGFVNVFVTPDFATAAVSGDVWKEVTPAGSHLAKSQALSDSSTLSESAALTQNYVGSDAFTLSESSSLNTGDVQKTGSDSFALASETAALTTADAKTGADTQTLSEGAAGLSLTSIGTDTQTLSEAAAGLAAALTGSDTQTLSETSQLSSPVAGTDAHVLNEQAASIVAAAVGSETHTLSESASLTTQDALSASDTATQSEGATTLARASALVDTATQSEGATVHAGSTAASDTQMLSQEISSLSGGSNPTGSDTQTLSSELASMAAVGSGADTFAVSELAAVSSAAIGTDLAIQSEASAELTQGLSRTDVFSMSESAVLEIFTSLTGTDAQSLAAEVASIQEVTFRAGTDQQVLSESAQLAVSVSVSDVHNLSESAGGTALLTATDLHTLVDMPGDALRLFQLAGSDLFTLDDQATLVQDDLDDDAFPVLNMRWPGVMIPGNIKFPSLEE
jgi:hypothetical protein